MPKLPPSQVVLFRRIIDREVDSVAAEITRRSGECRNRTFISVLGIKLTKYHDWLSILHGLQCGGKREVPEDLKDEVKEMVNRGYNSHLIPQEVLQEIHELF